MSKTMKKLICALLSSTMLLSSVGLVGFASEEAPAATEAPAADAAEATEAPAEDAADATEAPAEGADTTQTAPGPATNVDNSAYDNDDYYRRALEMVTSLGIIQGFEDGSVQPGSNVTRAQMAQIVLGMLRITSYSSYRGIYSDVADKHWAAGQIQTATDQGIINGMGDGTFVPDGNVTYAQVCVMLVRALNYESEAEQYGGWPNGYLNIASGVLDITDNASGQSEQPAERGLVIKMVYNALTGPYKEQRGYGALGQPEYNTNKTLAESKFDVKEGKGVLKATATTSITNSKLLAGQLLIDVDDDADDDDEGTLYQTSLTNLDGYVGSSITYYYQDKASGTETVLTAFSLGNKTRTEDLDVDEIEEFIGFDGTDTPAIKMYKSSTTKKFESDVEPTIVYNGKTITLSDFEAIPDSDVRKSKFIYSDGAIVESDEKATFNDFLKPTMGSVRIVDTNANGKYETIIIEKYETMLVTSASANKLIGKINGKNVTISDLDDGYKSVSVNRDGEEVRLRNLKKNDVASIKRDLDAEVIDIVVTAESFTGRISSKSSPKEDEDVEISVDGHRYVVDGSAVADIIVGADCAFYTDKFGRIGYLETITSNGMLQAGESYGWLMSVYQSESKEDYMIRVMTSEGSREFTPASSIQVWLNGESESKTYRNADLDKFLADISEDMRGSNDMFLKSGTTPIRLMKYKANSNGDISRMYFAVDSSSVKNESALRVDPNGLGGVPVQSGLVGGYSITDGLLEISVPRAVENMNSAANYKFGEVKSSAYVVRENGSSRTFVVGEFTGSTSPSILINFTASADAIASISDLDTAGNNPVMVIDSIDNGFDEDGNEIYTINGYSNGSAVSITTNSNTAIARLANTNRVDGSGGYAIGDKYDCGNKHTRVAGARMYNHKHLWDAQNGFCTTEDNYNHIVDSFDDVIDEGDLILYQGGDLILKVQDADEVYDYLTTGSSAGSEMLLGLHNNYVARNEFMCQTLENNEIDDIAWVDLTGGLRLSFDSSKTMQLITLSSRGADIQEDAIDVSELTPYDPETNTGDFVFSRMADKGSLQEIFVYRVE